MTKPTCKIDECASPTKGHGWCQVHYARWRKHGDPTVVAADRSCRYCAHTFTPTNGRQVVCSACKPAKMADYQERSKEYRESWRIANQDHLNELQRIQRGKDREKSRAYSRMKGAEWRKKHPGYIAEYTARRRARIAESGWFQVSDSEKSKVLARHHGKCAYCFDNAGAEWDHVLPIALGGRHSIGNLAPACRSCNASKGHKTLMEWRVWKMRYAPTAA